jgi:hypothetical protein
MKINNTGRFSFDHARIFLFLQADLVIRVEGRIWKIFRKLPQRMKCIKKIREYFFFDLVEEIDLDKKDETYGLPIDAINTILKQEKVI